MSIDPFGLDWHELPEHTGQTRCKVSLNFDLFAVAMEHIHSVLTVSISELKQNPEKVVEEAHGQPVAVLNHNRPVFYTVSPQLMAQMAELYDERKLATLVQSRVKSVRRAVKVNLDDL
jgi:antitoxin StbD